MPLHVSDHRVRARSLATVATGLAAAGLLAGCSGGSSSADRSPSPTSVLPSVGATTSSAAPAPAPKVGSCHRLTLAQATAPTDATAAVPCRRSHTTVTYYVGRFDPVVDGHLLAVDSSTVQAQLAKACPARLAAYVGGDQETRDLSRLHAVWFGPTVAQAETGARWFRCDVVATADESTLAPLTGTLKGALTADDALARYGTCASTAPTKPGFAHEICSRPHTWQAIATVDLSGKRFHGKAAQAAAESTCNDAATTKADGALKYSAGFEWPSRADWRQGRRFGLCWYSP